MGDHSNNKRAAEAFVDNYFPLKKPSSMCDVLDQVIPPNSTQEPSKTQGSADGHSQSKPRKSTSTPRKGSAAVIVCDTESDPSLMSLGVNYGARDYYYPSPSSSRNTGNSYEKDKKDVYDYTTPENSHEWWQGSYHY
ncbi:uncharacterized protein M6B38_322335 [Iris pallida]|uniref:Uncharacterized protein n=1 Tax=Iris pallida TaxID=29817 RepID=A0AAX6HBR6_IRIPA|nr:uncharacterized protein M6B38_322335 [Iris pallida]